MPVHIQLDRIEKKLLNTQMSIDSFIQWSHRDQTASTRPETERSENLTNELNEVIDRIMKRYRQV